MIQLERQIPNSEPIVEAYLRALAGQQAIESGDTSHDPVDVHFAHAAFLGTEQQVLACSIAGPGHAALVAILLAERLSRLIEQNESGRDQITVDARFRGTVDRLASAAAHLWDYLRVHGGAELLPVARQYGVAR